MIKKNLTEQERIDKEDKKMLTISLPNYLYQLLLKKSGKGNIGNYIRKAVKEKLEEEEMILAKAYRILEENTEYQEEINSLQKNWEEKGYEKAEQKKDLTSKKRAKHG